MRERGPTSYLTVRNLPPRVAEALDAEKRRREISLNQTVIELLQSSLGIDVTGAPHDWIEAACRRRLGGHGFSPTIGTTLRFRG